MAGTTTLLDIELRQRPIRELRTALVRLGRPIAGCVERSDFVCSLLDATEPELVAALGAQAEGSRERLVLLRQLLDGFRKPSPNDAPSEAENTLTLGSVVRLFNLQSAPALNMQRAVVLRHDPASDRYEVRLDWDGSVKKVRYDNLQVEENSSTPPASIPSPQPAPEYGKATLAPTAAAPGAEPAVASAVPEGGTHYPPATLAPTATASSTEVTATAEVGEEQASAATEPLMQAAVPTAMLSPERRRKSGEETAEQSPAESLADSLAGALATECGLDEPEASAGKSPTMVQEDSTSSPSDRIALAMPCDDREVALPGASIGSCTEVRNIRSMPTEDQAIAEAVADAPMCNSEPTGLGNSKPVAECQESETHRGSKRPAEEIAEAPVANCPPTAPFVLPQVSGNMRSHEVPVSMTTFSGGQPKKAVKLRVSYDVGRQPAEERGFMADGLRRLWRAGDLCDVTLACRESTFLVHRLVMVSQSKELRDFIADHSIVQVSNVAYPESLQIMIEYVYEAEGEKGYAPSCYEVNMEVLDLSHRFQLPGLKRRAASFMAQGLTSHNVLKSLSECDTFALPDLKEKIISHLAVNKKVLGEITDGPHIAHHPELLRQILVRVASPKEYSGRTPSKRVRVSHSQ